MTTTILVQMADSKWTAAAMQAACDLASGTRADITLVKMLPSSYLNWLGLEASEYQFSEDERDNLEAFAAIARAANVDLHTTVVKYDDMANSLSQLADQLGAEIVFATTPHHRDLAHLDRSLEAHHHHLYTVEQPAACCSDWQPKATAVHHS